MKLHEDFAKEEAEKKKTVKFHGFVGGKKKAVGKDTMPAVIKKAITKKGK
jgi:hypothetical protein